MTKAKKPLKYQMVGTRAKWVPDELNRWAKKDYGCQWNDLAPGTKRALIRAHAKRPKPETRAII